MPVERAFLKPRSVDAPPQGDFVYEPVVALYESDTAAGLEALLEASAGVRQASTTEFWVVEDVQYQVVVLQHALGMNPAIVRYSALVRLTKVLKV